VSWDGKDDSGYILPSGIYLYSMQINDYKAFRKMTFTK
jgi:hypothetical protein